MAGTAKLVLHIEPYIELTTTLHPNIARARRKAAFDVTVANTGNAPAHVALLGTAPNDELRFEFDRPPHEVPFRGEVVSRMWVTTARPIWTGSPRDHSLDVQTFTGEEAPPTLPVHGTFRQISWLSWRLAPPLLLVLALLLIVALL